MNKRRPFICRGACRILFLSALVAGCQVGADSASVVSPSLSRAIGVEGGQRDDSGRLVVEIEGMPQAMPVRLYEAPEDFPLAFSTYVPHDMVAVRSGAGTIRLAAAFAGQRNDDARLEVVALPLEVDAAAAQRQAKQTARALGGERTSRHYSWADAVYTLTGSVSGFLALGQYRGRWFYLLARYPPEYGDGMAARIALILRQWCWADGVPLQPSGDNGCGA